MILGKQNDVQFETEGVVNQIWLLNLKPEQVNQEERLIRPCQPTQGKAQTSWSRAPETHPVIIVFDLIMIQL
jgi:hypothetical protein